MNAKLVEDIANAVLYEGYMLYPYRPSSVKNRQRWNFGVVYPKTYSEMQSGSDNWFQQTECLATGTEIGIALPNTHSGFHAMHFSLRGAKEAARAIGGVIGDTTTVGDHNRGRDTDL